MTDAFVLSACRTPIGRFRGALAWYRASDLGALVVREAVARAKVDAAEVDEVILGNVLTAGAGQAPARQAALGAGLPPEVAALTVNKVCGSGLKAVMLAAQAVRVGDADLVVAGGMESMSRAGWVLPRKDPGVGDRQLIDTLMHDGLTCALSGRGMGDIAEELAAQTGTSREEQDAFALQSHRRATTAMKAGLFDDEIIPIAGSEGNNATVTCDEGPRADTSLDRLATLRSVFRASGTVTAGNSSMISDGAAAVVIASTSAARRVGQSPVARIVASATSGVPPEELFIAPVAAIKKVVAKAGLTLDDIDLFEINEAFAVQMLACLRQLDLAADRVNVHGGAIALGHPIGASGTRVLVSLIHAMRRRNVRRGIAALCLGGGNAVAMLIEREWN